MERKYDYSQDVYCTRYYSGETYVAFPPAGECADYGKVDSIHFIVTKSDTLGDMRSDRNVKAGELLRANYAAAVGQLKDYIRLTQRINRSTGFGVNAFTFSLGRFYLGDIFEIDVADTRNLIETIRNVTFGHREQTVWDRVKRFELILRIRL